MESSELRRGGAEEGGAEKRLRGVMKKPWLGALLVVAMAVCRSSSSSSSRRRRRRDVTSYGSAEERSLCFLHCVQRGAGEAAENRAAVAEEQREQEEKQ